MDAFKELATRSPDMELMTLEDSHAMVFWSGAAQYWAARKIDYAKSAEQTPALQEQMAAWVREGQKAGEFNIRANQYLGKLAKETSKAQSKAGGRGGGATASGEPLKWKRLGFKSLAAMKDAEFLEAHPKEADEVIERAKKNDDLPSKGAVRATVRYKKAEAAAAKAKAKDTDDQVKKTPKGVKEYLDVMSAYRKSIRFTIDYAKRDRFAPEWKQFIVKRHDELRQLLDELEESL